MMKCHYEVLEIPRDADDASVKTAYKKMALRWHPDKNLDGVEEAKEQFQLVQQAYEVLSDRQERAWYDSHREQILRSADNANTSAKEDVHLFDVFPYFTSTCFRGHCDDDEGFYAVYRHVFDSIAKEDLAEVDVDDKDDYLNIPSFGDSNSDYEDVVHGFYSYWMAYNTKVSYSWLDARVPKDIRDRRVFKLVEKENKKIRTKARRERNEEVRSLVEFVRKRDKRVQANVKRLQERAEENRKKQEQMSRERRSEQRKSNLAEEQAEWTKFDNVRAQLEEIERHLGLSDDSETGDDDDDRVRDDDPFLCVACNKLFKTQKAFENHEKSKKHKENVEMLKGVLQNEEDTFKNGCDIHEDDEEEEENEDTSDFASQKSKSSKRNRKKGKNKVLSAFDDLDLEDNIKVVTESSESRLDKPETIENQDDAAAITTRLLKIKRKRRKNKNEELEQSCENKHDDIIISDTDTCQTTHRCVTCKNNFTSNNKLYAHLKKTGHARPLA